MRRLALGAAAVLLMSGCGLPVVDGARSAGADADERSRAVGIKVLPPGPQPGATAEEVVRGFLRAQSSPDDDHAVARQFLAAGVEWDDDGVVVVYQPGSQTVQAAEDDPRRLSLSLERVALIGTDGAYRALPDAASPGTDEFTVDPGPGGELRITTLPAGLRLQTEDVGRSYAPREVFFLGRSAGGTATGRLVADRVFLPVTAEPARALVEALVAGPSARLRPAVTAAVPSGTRVVDVRVDPSLVVTVLLSAPVRQLSARERQRLSAQLVWTLASYAGVRLLVDGSPFEVEAAGEVQTVSDWDEYDPAGLSRDAPLHYVEDRVLRTFGGTAVGGTPDTGALPVDEVAVDPTGTQVGVRTRAGAVDEVRVAGPRGPFAAPVLRAAAIGSLSWGAGDRGLWVVETGSRSRLWLVPGPTAPAGTEPVVVPVALPPDSGPLVRAEISRDGARVALVLGAGEGRALYVGRVQPTATGVQVADVQPVAPTLRDVTDVSWAGSTSLAVLARDPDAAGVLVLEVAVDGSQTVPLPRPGVEGDPVAVAAAPGRPLVVAAVAGGRSQLLRDDGEVFAVERRGTAPTYPG